MSEREWDSREIVERIIVEGDLVLLTPTSLGNGDSDGLTDISLLLDEAEEEKKALLTGTSIAGALRSYLRERVLNYEISEESQYTDSNGRRLKNKSLPIVTQLFGSLEDDDGTQSCLIIDDALSSHQPTTELRDGVKIDGKTRTAEEGKKFDLELIEAGTTFKLRFELLISAAKKKDEDGNEVPMFPPRNELLKALATSLQGFEAGEIHLGARKRRGYGECKVNEWQSINYDLNTSQGLIDWLKYGAKEFKKLTDKEEKELNLVKDSSILKALLNDKTKTELDDKREWFEMTACFALDGSMLIRSGSKLNISEKGQPDTVHLRSKHKDRGSVPVVSGTSLAGVLRHRAVKICNTIADGKGKNFVEKIFGVDMEELKERNKNKVTKKQPYASRLEVKETFIKNTNDLVQTRVKIDRFTGGAFEGALFDAAPVFAKDHKQALAITLKLRNPKYCEIGLLFLLLKDLWTSDLAIGGESSIGRGRLKGLGAGLNFKNGAGSWSVKLKGDAGDNAKVEIEEYFEKVGEVKTDKKKEEGYSFLNKFVDALNERNWETEANNVG